MPDALTKTPKYKLAILTSHLIQYFSPMYRRLAQEERIELTVYYCSRQGLDTYVDVEFGETVKWDIDLLDGYTYKFLPNMRKSGAARGFFKLINPAIINELRREKFDALWIHGHRYATDIIAVAAARLTGTPVFIRGDSHLFRKRSKIKQFFRDPIMNIFYRNCAICLAVGSHNADYYVYHGVPKEKIELVPYTVDNNYFIEKVAENQDQRNIIRGELGLSQHTPIILYTSKLVPNKNPMHLLQAYQRLRQRDIDAALVFIGSGSEMEALKAYTDQHNLDHVHFLGFKNQSDLPKYYAASDIFVLPTQQEAFGLVINEVMCAGLPVVASAKIGAVPDLVHDGVNGFTFEAGDINALATHLEKLCTDDALRQQMGENSFNMIQQWSYEEVVSGVLAALKKVAG